jgi:hypothetical protein
VPDNVVTALFKYEKDLATHVSIESDGTLRFADIKMKFDVFGGEHVTGKAAHALGEIVEVVPIGINGPHNVAHGIHEFP